LLTVQVRKLEHALEVRLFDRNSRTVALTAIGRELLPVLQRTVEDLDAVLFNARSISAGKRGTVRIASLPSRIFRLLDRSRYGLELFNGGGPVDRSCPARRPSSCCARFV
jgi:DNA-binding transcriptional LysR family regulator